MATGWNYVWGESWHEYVQRSTLTDDITAAQRESSKAMVAAISEQTASIIGGTESNLRALSRQMEDISAEISELNASFQWGFGQMIAQMGGMNTSLQTLIQIAKTPVQTWAYNQFEIARENFRKALYTNCIKRLDKAINGDQASAGYEEEWRFHQMIGVVRLGFIGGDSTLIDVVQAEKAFLLAAQYARVDEPHEAAKAHLSAGWSAFVLGKLPIALSHTEHAIALDPKLSEAFFQLAKFQMASNAPVRALATLRTAIDQAPGYVVKAAADGDFQRHNGELNSFFAKVREEVYAALVPQVEQALADADTWSTTIREVAECSPISDRWRDLLRGPWGLVELLDYRREGFDRDRQCVADSRSRGMERIDADEAAAKREVAGLSREIEAERKALSSDWKPVAIGAASVPGLLLSALICQGFANARGSGFLNGLANGLGALGTLIFGLGFWASIVVVPVWAIVTFVSTIGRRAKIAELETALSRLSNE